MQLSDTFLKIMKFAGQIVIITLSNGIMITGFLDTVEYDEDGDYFILDDVFPKGAPDYGELSDIVKIQLKQ